MHITSNYFVFDIFRSGGNTMVSVNYKLIRFQPPSGLENKTCQENLYGIKEKSFFSECNNKESIREVQNNNAGPIELTQQTDFFFLFYKASNKTSGGIFWIQIKGRLYTQTLYRFPFSVRFKVKVIKVN